jgi:hypothetical protein
MGLNSWYCLAQGKSVQFQSFSSCFSSLVVLQLFPSASREMVQCCVMLKICCGIRSPAAEVRKVCCQVTSFNHVGLWNEVWFPSILNHLLKSCIASSISNSTQSYVSHPPIAVLVEWRSTSFIVLHKELAEVFLCAGGTMGSFKMLLGD